MKMKMFRLIGLVAGLAITMPALPQALNEGQGHPLKGVWLGDWGTDKDKRNPVTIEMDWDGKAITGSINPGPDAAVFTKAELDPSNWTVHLEAESKGIRYVIDGKIQNLGSLRRSIVGTWSEGNQKGSFKITRH
jgi:hypothetical protein